MSDFFQNVVGDQDPFKKLAAYIPGFSGYIERTNRRAADKLLRETVARRFEDLYKRTAALQTDLISQGGIALLDDMEKASIQIRTFADKVRNASYGYSGFFDAVKINEEELTKLYEFDAAFFATADNLNRALDNVEAALGDSEALPGAIRHLITLAREATQTFNNRYEVIIGSGG